MQSTALSQSAWPDEYRRRLAPVFAAAALLLASGSDAAELLPVYAPAALLTARFLERWRRGELVLMRGAMAVCLVFLGLIGVGLTAGDHFAEG